MASSTSVAAGANTTPTLLPPPRLAGIVLAAGRASRFGSDKRQATFDDKHTLLSRSIALIEPVCAHVVVVARPGDEESNLLGMFNDDQHIEQFIAPDALRGMGASLANGIARVTMFESQQAHAFDGVLVMLADMPFIQTHTIHRLIEGFANDKIIVPSYLEQHKEKKWGNPVLFSRKWFSALQSLNGDRGAKALIKANPCARVEVVVDDLGILRDIDTPEDLDRVEQ